MATIIATNISKMCRLDDASGLPPRYPGLSVTTGADVVDCGAGVDTVHYDNGVDKIRHCEVKVRTTQ